MQEENNTQNINNTTTASTQNNDKLWNALAYALFFIPLLINPRPVDAKFHANQSLNILIVSVIGHLILSMIPIVRNFAFILSIFTLVLVIIGIINVINGKKEKLPVIGNLFELIK